MKTETPVVTVTRSVLLHGAQHPRQETPRDVPLAIAIVRVIESVKDEVAIAPIDRVATAVRAAVAARPGMATVVISIVYPQSQKPARTVNPSHCLKRSILAISLLG